MFKHLLVPLDGSRLSEAAIPAGHPVGYDHDAMTTIDASTIEARRRRTA